MTSNRSSWARSIRRASGSLTLLAAIVVAGCSPAPSGQPSSSAPPGSTPSAAPESPSAEPATPAPSPTNTSSEGGPAVACIGVEPSTCQGSADQIIAAVLPTRGPPFAILVWPDSAVVEFATGGPPIRVDLKPGEPPVPAANDSWLGPFEPSSTGAAGPGPFPFEVGHCGLMHQVDFDGSFWLPFGPVDGESPAMIGSESGQIVLIAPDHAQYSGADGNVVNLIRFPGPKHTFGCR